MSILISALGNIVKCGHDAATMSLRHGQGSLQIHDLSACGNLLLSFYKTWLVYYTTMRNMPPFLRIVVCGYWALHAGYVLSVVGVSW